MARSKYDLTLQIKVQRYYLTYKITHQNFCGIKFCSFHTHQMKFPQNFRPHSTEGNFGKFITKTYLAK